MFQQKIFQAWDISLLPMTQLLAVVALLTRQYCLKSISNFPTAIKDLLPCLMVSITDLPPVMGLMMDPL